MNLLKGIFRKGGQEKGVSKKMEASLTDAALRELQNLQTQVSALLEEKAVRDRDDAQAAELKAAHRAQIQQPMTHEETAELQRLLSQASSNVVTLNAADFRAALPRIQELAEKFLYQYGTH